MEVETGETRLEPSIY